MKVKLFALAVASAGLFASLSQKATAQISTIQGYYGEYTADDPELAISNNTVYDFTTVQLTLTGYQGINNGVVQVVNLGTILAGTDPLFNWNGGLYAQDLFAGDYDDEYPSVSNPSNAACVLNDTTSYGAPSPNYWCADVGNFYVTMTAQWNGESIYSQFSPSDNATGTFIGWEGLDPNGWSESIYDDHSSGGPNGVLANIFVGTPPPIPTGTTPEPSSFVLLGTGLAGLIGAARRRFAA